MPRRKEQKPFLLFTYGTLMDPGLFRAVTGLQVVKHKGRADGVRRVLARRGILHGYKKISPDHAYLYAVPDPHGRIRGYLIGPLPGRCMDALHHYEGRNYSKRTVRIQTRAGAERAVAFVANRRQLEHAFGYDFHDHLKQEVLLEEKIEAALITTERQQLHETERVSRRAVAELHGSTIRDLKRRHFDAGGISDYAIRQALLDTPLRDFTRIAADPEANALAPNYLEMVIRQVLFNQFEDRIRQDFRYELDRMSADAEYYERTASSLAALRMVNASDDLLDLLIADCLTDLSFPGDHLVDFVRWAIVAADAVYDPHLAEHEIDFIRRHKGRGYIPMGAELEFSNIGHSVIRDPDGRDVRDSRYDGFLYFPDFGLDILTWKLGGHVDDHHDKASLRPRRGFFEVAMGNLSIEANISKPLTDDPWLLSQLIHEARRFYRIAPHSVHISLQMPTQHRPVQDRLLPLEVMKCLFAIAGDPIQTADGRVQIKRLATDEILTREGGPRMLFSQIARRHSSESDESYPLVRPPRAGGRYVQQFKFLRLAPELNYEPVAMALKGLQIRLRPGSFLTASQYESSAKHRKLLEALLAWGADPQPLSHAETDAFLKPAYEGLMAERRGEPAHSGAYIAWAIDQLRRMLTSFNMLITWARDPRPPAATPPANDKGADGRE